jgi:hypothetical protein
MAFLASQDSLSMKFVIFFIFILKALPSYSSEIKMAIFTGFGHSGQSIGAFRADTVALYGGYFSAGIFGSYHNFAPQVVDTSYGLALHVGTDWYVELQAGIFNRTFQQVGTEKLVGDGYSGNLVFGMNLSPNLGIDIALSVKRISKGELTKRTIVDLLPLIAIRTEF